MEAFSVLVIYGIVFGMNRRTRRTNQLTLSLTADLLFVGVQCAFVREQFVTTSLQHYSF